MVFVSRSKISWWCGVFWNLYKDRINSRKRHLYMYVYSHTNYYPADIGMFLSRCLGGNYSTAPGGYMEY